MVEDESVPGCYGCIGRRMAVAILRNAGCHRSYLLRSSQSGPDTFAVSFRVDPFVRHFTIRKQRKNDGSVCYMIGKREFCSLAEIVAHYNQWPLSDNLCLGDPVISTSLPEFYVPLSTRLNGVTTTHGSRIHCYDFPSSIKENCGHIHLRLELPAKSDQPGAGGMVPAVNSISNLPPLTSRCKQEACLKSQAFVSTSSLLTCSDDVLATMAKHPQEKKAFVRFVQESYLEETLMFLCACKNYQRIADSLLADDELSVPILHELAMVLFVKFLTPASMYEVNLSISTVKEIRTVLDRLSGTLGNRENFQLLAGLFDEAVKQAHLTVSTDLYPRYMSTRAYRSPLQSGVTA